ncbi:hypothetical protein ACGFIV_08515 [Sphaerisporangium sp. NPDC049003]|uniref:hypothetical protein n=1 Tax=Sphaerisporangium sp. NPDC049003 TaxID=3364517 RepID=UPI0037210FC5
MPPWAKRAARAVARQIVGFTSGVAVAVSAPLVGQALSTWSPITADIGIERPHDGTHDKALPCLTVSGHGTPQAGSKLVVAVQQSYPEAGAITFFPDVRVVDGEWQITVPLNGPEDSWFTIRAVVLDSEQAHYLGTVGGTAGMSRWISPTMPPGSAIADSVDVQRGPGQISC